MNLNYLMSTKRGRLAYFEEEGQHLLSEVVDVEVFAPNSYRFNYKNKNYSYFPKSNKLHKQMSNEWESDGWGWIKKFVLKTKTINNE